MTSENIQYPIGTIVREDHKHTDDTDGQTTWVLVQDHATVGNEITKTYPTWVVLFSTSVSNLGQALGYDELPLDKVEVIGTIPGTPAAEQAAAEAEKVIRGDYPRITWGTKPNGSPWAVHVDFGSGVAINSTGDLWDNKRVITAEQADRKSIALREAVGWIVNDLVAVSEDFKTFQLSQGEQPKQKPRKTRIAVDKSGYLLTWSPREGQSSTESSWVRQLGENSARLKATVKVTELTDADSITVTATNTSAVAAFMGGTLEFAQHTNHLCDVRIPGDGRVGLQLLMKIWRTEDTLYLLYKGATLFIPMRRGA